MGWDVENTAQEIADLKGATILSAKIKPGVYDDARIIELTVRFREGHAISDDGVTGYTEGTYQIWQDAEGNGPGYIALVGMSKPLKAKKAAA